MIETLAQQPDSSQPFTETELRSALRLLKSSDDHLSPAFIAGLMMQARLHPVGMNFGLFAALCVVSERFRRRVEPQLAAVPADVRAIIVNEQERLIRLKSGGIQER